MQISKYILVSSYWTYLTVNPTENNRIDDVNNNVDSHMLENTSQKLGSLTDYHSISNTKVTDVKHEGTHVRFTTDVVNLGSYKV